MDWENIWSIDQRPLWRWHLPRTSRTWHLVICKFGRLMLLHVAQFWYNCPQSSSQKEHERASFVEYGKGTWHSKHTCLALLISSTKLLQYKPWIQIVVHDSSCKATTVSSTAPKALKHTTHTEFHQATNARQHGEWTPAAWISPTKCPPNDPNVWWVLR